jgi:hypothetical protein
MYGPKYSSILPKPIVSTEEILRPLEEHEVIPFHDFCKRNPLIPRSEPFSVPYYVTDDSTQNEIIIGFHLGRGQVTRIDKSTIQHLDGQIVNTTYVLGSDVNFWINNPRYNSIVGIDEIEWTFPDGALAWGWNVRHTPKARGLTQVKIIDKLGKVQKIYKNN